ncbi:Putative uncharacterized protein FLJ37770, partial [Harpegnathos saltator]
NKFYYYLLLFKYRGVRNGQNKPSSASVRYEMSSQQPNTSTSASSVRSTYSSEIHSIIRFLTLRNESAARIHRPPVETYGSEVMNRQNVSKWIRSFKEGRTDTHDEERNGRPSVISENLVQQV